MESVPEREWAPLVKRTTQRQAGEAVILRHQQTDDDSAFPQLWRTPLRSITLCADESPAATIVAGHEEPWIEIHTGPLRAIEVRTRPDDAMEWMRFTSATGELFTLFFV